MDKNVNNLYQYRLNRDKARHYGRGRKTSPSLQLEELESEAKVQQMIGNTQHGKQGLGFRKSFRLSDSDKERRHQLCLIMQKDAEQKRLVILQKYEMQNSWLTWVFQT